jgi:hypothetical protein
MPHTKNLRFEQASGTGLSPAHLLAANPIEHSFGSKPKVSLIFGCSPVAEGESPADGSASLASVRWIKDKYFVFVTKILKKYATQPDNE